MEAHSHSEVFDICHSSCFLKVYSVFINALKAILLATKKNSIFFIDLEDSNLVVEFCQLMR